MKKNIIYFLATAFGLGYFPKLPGTFTSLVATIAAYYLLQIALPYYLLLIVLVTLAGVYITGEANRLAGEKDKNIFSYDEVPGQWLAFLPLYWYGDQRLFLLFLGFALFRFFDIVKPGLIRRSEELPGGWGVMIDDVLSGIAAAICLQIVIFFFTITGL
jgi:phosphatidylglycerophosphatase A